MIAPSLIGLACGLVLGTRFKVMAVVLIELVVVVLLLGLAALGRASFGQAMMALMCLSVALQAGYVGMTLGMAMAPRTTRMTRVSKA